MKNLDQTHPESQEELWKDITGRAMFGDIMIHDTTGKADAMFFNCDADSDFGDEVKAASKNVVRNIQP